MDPLTLRWCDVCQVWFLAFGNASFEFIFLLQLLECSTRCSLLVGSSSADLSPSWVSLNCFLCGSHIFVIVISALACLHSEERPAVTSFTAIEAKVGALLREMQTCLDMLNHFCKWFLAKTTALVLLYNCQLVYLNVLCRWQGANGQVGYLVTWSFFNVFCIQARLPGQAELWS